MLTRYRILKDEHGYYWDCNLYPLVPFFRYSPYKRYLSSFPNTPTKKHETLEECLENLENYKKVKAKPIVVKRNLT
jgi:hypothetical protein